MLPSLPYAVTNEIFTAAHEKQLSQLVRNKKVKVMLSQGKLALPQHALTHIFAAEIILVYLLSRSCLRKKTRCRVNIDIGLQQRETEFHVK